jgi:hypothetical protein
MAQYGYVVTVTPEPNADHHREYTATRNKLG